MDIDLERIAQWECTAFAQNSKNFCANFCSCDGLEISLLIEEFNKAFNEVCNILHLLPSAEQMDFAISAAKLPTSASQQDLIEAILNLLPQLDSIFDNFAIMLDAEIDSLLYRSVQHTFFCLKSPLLDIATSALKQIACRNYNVVNTSAQIAIPK